jgi:hypothetical protein
MKAAGKPSKSTTPLATSVPCTATPPSTRLSKCIDCLQSGKEPLLSTRNAIRATELIFATYESARRGGRIHLPLDIEDSPLISMLNERNAANA